MGRSQFDLERAHAAVAAPLAAPAALMRLKVLSHIAHALAAAGADAKRLTQRLDGVQTSLNALGQFTFADPIAVADVHALDLVEVPMRSSWQIYFFIATHSHSHNRRATAPAAPGPRRLAAGRRSLYSPPGRMGERTSSVPPKAQSTRNRSGKRTVRRGAPCPSWPRNSGERCPTLTCRRHPPMGHRWPTATREPLKTLRYQGQRGEPMNIIGSPLFCCSTRSRTCPPAGQR